MRLTTWAVLTPLGCCLVLGYACCRGLHDPVTLALYHLFAYWALLGALFVAAYAALEWSVRQPWRRLPWRQIRRTQAAEGYRRDRPE